MPVYTPPVPPQRTYSCGHCGKLIPRVMALRQAGYCERCEFMTAVEVMRHTLLSRPTLLAKERRGEWTVVRIDARPLYHRADVVAYVPRKITR
jgi:hypothetical protein